MSSLRNAFNSEFVMQMFLDSDDILTLNRSITTAANVLYENVNNLNNFNQTSEECFESIAEKYISNDIEEHRIKTYYEDVVLKFSDEEYKDTFKANRKTVQELINFLTEFESPGGTPLDKKVHIFLMCLTSDLSFNNIGKLFGIQKSSVIFIFEEIGTVIFENRFTYISWPTVDDQHMTRLKVNSIFKFPNCVGFIDTCHLSVGLKGKKKNTILLQAVCDDSFMFLDIHIGEIGNTKKYKVFKESSLANELPNFVDFENHLLGDAEYKLKLNLITPYNSDEILTSEEMKFNEVHLKTRSYIGGAFELLKERFRKLNHIDVFKSECINILIYSACVLHNFILMHEGCSEIKEEVITCDGGITLNIDIVKTPEEKRQFLCNYINYIDRNDFEVLSEPSL